MPKASFRIKCECFVSFVFFCVENIYKLRTTAKRDVVYCSPRFRVVLRIVFYF